MEGTTNALANAEQLYWEAAESVKAGLGKTHVQYAAILNNIALLYCNGSGYFPSKFSR